MSPQVVVEETNVTLVVQEERKVLRATIGLGNATQLRGRVISASAPADGEALVWSAALSEWVPANIGTQTEIDAISASLAAHVANTSNPHAVTAAQVGAYTIAATDAAIAAHATRTDNPHAVTASQLVGGNLAYAHLPTGNGTWDTGAGTTATFAQAVAVLGTLDLSGALRSTSTGRFGASVISSGATLEINAVTGAVGVAPLLFRIRTTRSGSGWDAAALWAGIDFYSEDTNSPGARSMWRLGPRPEDGTGAQSTLVIQGNPAGVLTDYLTITSAGVVTVAVRLDLTSLRVGTTTPSAGADIEVNKAAGASGLQSIVRVRSTRAGSGWDSTQPWGAYDFYSDDSAGAGARVHWRIGAQTVDGTGDQNNLVFQGNPSGTLTTYLTITSAGVATFVGTVVTAASTTSGAGLRLPHGSAPTSPVNGDIWTTTAGLFVRLNGTTRTVTVT